MTLVWVFVLAALIIVIFGTLLTREADRLADRTGLGEAVFGAVFLGASTSLSGSVASMVVAFQGFPELAAANAVGGIAVQTFWLAVADMTYRRANLEHAAASLENLLLGTLLVVLLAFPLVARFVTDYTIFEIHPASLILFAAYAYGIRVVQKARAAPLWQARTTSETREDVPGKEHEMRTWVMWSRFTALVLVAGISGYIVAQAGVELVQRTGVSQNTVGAFITAVITSLPELVVTLAAVRQGALTLAVGGIIGGNSFDVLFLAFSDIAYRQGSIYHDMGGEQVLIITVSIAMAGILLMGLLRRERRGVAGIGFESVGIALLYVGLLVFQLVL
ncbi:MAG: sodium:calcium antiporter [Euryarchaeota archaeon]|nr:sodium:calcium antiporter [Euryarchaeota archaeon]